MRQELLREKVRRRYEYLIVLDFFADRQDLLGLSAKGRRTCYD
jgi:hypothetical protein